MALVTRRRGKWVADYRNPRTGRRHWITRATRKAAENALQQALAEINAGTFRPPTEAIRFNELADAFLISVRPTVRASTFADYQGIITRLLLPAFTGYKLRDIEPHAIERFRDQLFGKEVQRQPLRRVDAT